MGVEGGSGGGVEGEWMGRCGYQVEGEGRIFRREEKTCAKKAALCPTGSVTRPDRSCPTTNSDSLSLSPLTLPSVPPPVLPYHELTPPPQNGPPEPPGAGCAETRATAGRKVPERDPCGADTKALFQRRPTRRKVRTKHPSPPPKNPHSNSPTANLSRPSSPQS